MENIRIKYKLVLDKIKCGMFILFNCLHFVPFKTCEQFYIFIVKSEVPVQFWEACFWLEKNLQQLIQITHVLMALQ